MRTLRTRLDDDTTTYIHQRHLTPSDYRKSIFQTFDVQVWRYHSVTAEPSPSAGSDIQSFLSKRTVYSHKQQWWSMCWESTAPRSSKPINCLLPTAAAFRSEAPSTFDSAGCAEDPTFQKGTALSPESQCPHLKLERR